jgi:hypothetical protein
MKPFLLALAAVAGLLTVPVSAAAADTPPVRSFEVEAVGSVPSGCPTPAGKAAAAWSRTVGLGSTCTSTITGRHDGPVRGTSGTTCISGATVTGPVAVSNGADLIMRNSSLRSGLRATRARTVAICGSRVTGPVSITATTRITLLGDRTRGCPHHPHHPPNPVLNPRPPDHRQPWLGRDSGGPELADSPR